MVENVARLTPGWGALQLFDGVYKLTGHAACPLRRALCLAIVLHANVQTLTNTECEVKISKYTLAMRLHCITVPGQHHQPL